MGKSGPLNYGNLNLKGKKHLLLNCKCCTCLDKREQMLSKAINKETSFESDPHLLNEDECDAYYWHETILYGSQDDLDW